VLSLSQAARQVLVARCAQADTLGQLGSALVAGDACLRVIVEGAASGGRPALAQAVTLEIDRVQAMLLLLAEPGDSEALTQLAGQLRDIGRPDLAEQSATDAIGLDPGNPAAWVVRAAARADLRNHVGALADLDREFLVGNLFAGVTRVRVLRDAGRLRDALATATLLAEEHPTEISVVMIRSLAAGLGDEVARLTAERLFGALVSAGEPEPPSRLLGLLAAQQLDREGDLAGALRLARTVAAERPRWQRAETLVQRLASRRNGTIRSPQESGRPAAP
jgi:hypothetical protein